MHNELSKINLEVTKYNQLQSAIEESYNEVLHKLRVLSSLSCQYLYLTENLRNTDTLKYTEDKAKYISSSNRRVSFADISKTISETRSQAYLDSIKDNLKEAENIKQNYKNKIAYGVATAYTDDSPF